MPPAKITFKDSDRLRLEDEDRRRKRAILFRSYQSNPVGYAKDILKVGLTAAQEQILDSVASSRRTAVMGSHGIGKTYVAALLASWWYDTREKSICYITAPTWDAAKEKTFNQLRLLRTAVGLSGRLMETGFLKDDDKNLDPIHFVRTLNAEKGEAFQGEHKAPILVLLDESPGVPSYIWSAAKGLMTGAANRMMAVGNPVDRATPFGKACKDKGWAKVQISALDHPNILAGLECRPPSFPENDLGLLWLREMLEDECEIVNEGGGSTFTFWSLPTIEAALNGEPVADNPNASRWTYLPTGDFEGRVLGRFPTREFEQVIPESWLDALSPIPLQPIWMPEVGADPAWTGADRTAIAARRGPCVTVLRQMRHFDPDAVAGAIIGVVRDACKGTSFHPKQVPIRIDVTGGLGAGPWSILRSQGYNVEAVNSSSNAFDPESFKNRRSELWFATRERARLRDLDLCKLPKEIREQLESELSTPKYKRDLRGKKVVEEKPEIKKNLGWSPDLADALNLAFYPSPLRAAAETVVEDDPFGYEDERI